MGMTKLNVATLFFGCCFSLLVTEANAQSDDQRYRELEWECATGDAETCVALAQDLYRGNGIAEGYDETTELFQRGCDGGSDFACAWVSIAADRQYIAEHYYIQNRIRFDTLTHPEACLEYDTMDYLDQLSWHIANLDGVRAVDSLPFRAKRSNAGWNGGNLRWTSLPRNRFSLVQATSPIPTSTYLLNQNCSLLPIIVYLDNRRIESLQQVSDHIQSWRADNPNPELDIQAPIVTNAIYVALVPTDGEIWSSSFLIALKNATDAVFYLPYVDRRTVTSLWTPNSRYYEATEEGFRADDVMPNRVTPENLAGNSEALEEIRENTIAGGYVGQLVASDFNSALVYAELLDRDPESGTLLNYCELADRLSELQTAIDLDVRFEILMPEPEMLRC